MIISSLDGVQKTRGEMGWVAQPLHNSWVGAYTTTLHAPPLSTRGFVVSLIALLYFFDVVDASRRWDALNAAREVQGMVWKPEDMRCVEENTKSSPFVASVLAWSRVPLSCGQVVLVESS